MNILDYFPLDSPREKQVKALEFVGRAIERGYKDIVISAPTGIGKSALCVALCNWAGSLDASMLQGQEGGYILVTQKMLQDQFENDIKKYKRGLNSAVTLKTAAEYECPRHKNCAIGMRMKFNKCNKDECTYQRQKAAFMCARCAITNYPYFFTEREYVGQFQPRRILAADECHSLEGQLIHFVDLVVSNETLPEYAWGIAEIPDFRNIDDFIAWIKEEYLPASREHKSVIEANLESTGAAADIDHANRIDKHIKKVEHAIDTFAKGTSDWVYWKEDTRKGCVHTARPIDAAPFTKDLIQSMADVRVYMSAYPGVKEVFCRSLGLDIEKVAWCGLGSTFPPENRRVLVYPLGSMSRRNQEATMPSMVKIIKKIMRKHANEKGIVHCSSYKLGEAILASVQGTELEERIIYPTKSGERAEFFKQHIESLLPTIIVSPSMYEGFDFKEDLARWQIIAKVMYPSLSDKQVVAKMDRDREWYNQQTVSCMIQAAGRVCRSETDHGVTYIFDADFVRLWKECEHMFPAWFKKAVVMLPTD